MRLTDALRGTALLVVAKALIVALAGVTLYNLASFAQSTRDAVDTTFSESSRVELFGLTDRLADPGDFERFRSSPASIRTATRFYDALNRDDQVQLLSAFDQSVPVAGFRGGDEFDHGFGTEMGARGAYDDEVLGPGTVAVKSLQLNRAAFDFAGLRTTPEVPFDWSDIDFGSGSVPVLLGADYRGVYDVGDTLRGSYYFQVTDFTVTGFLEPDSSVFYQGTIDFFLDDHVVIPYPPSASDFADDDAFFVGILAFAMMTANLAAPTDMSGDEVLSIVATAAASSGFTDYAVLGIPGYLTQFSQVRSLIMTNLGLVIGIEIAILATSGVLVMALGRAAARRRGQVIAAAWTLGVRPGRLRRIVAAAVVVDFAVAAALCAVIVDRLPNDDRGSGLLVAAATIALFAIDSLVHQRLLTTTLARKARQLA